jgi:uncharacterized protein YrrD
MGYIILALIVSFSVGFIYSAWISSKTIVKKDNTIEEYKNKLIASNKYILKLQEEISNLNYKSSKIYPTYSDKI